MKLKRYAVTVIIDAEDIKSAKNGISQRLVDTASNSFKTWIFSTPVKVD